MPCSALQQVSGECCKQLIAFALAIHHLLGYQKSTIPSNASHLLRRPPSRVICWLQLIGASILPTPSTTDARLMKTEICEPHLTGWHFYLVWLVLWSLKGGDFILDFGLRTFKQHFGCMFITKHPPHTTCWFCVQTYPRSLSFCDITDEDVDGGDLASCLDNAGRDLVVEL